MMSKIDQASDDRVSEGMKVGRQAERSRFHRIAVKPRDQSQYLSLCLASLLAVSPKALALFTVSLVLPSLFALAHGDT